MENYKIIGWVLWGFSISYACYAVWKGKPCFGVDYWLAMTAMLIGTVLLFHIY